MRANSSWGAAPGSSFASWIACIALSLGRKRSQQFEKWDYDEKCGNELQLDMCYRCHGMQNQCIQVGETLTSSFMRILVRYHFSVCVCVFMFYLCVCVRCSCHYGFVSLGASIKHATFRVCCGCWVTPLLMEGSVVVCIMFHG